MAVIAGARTWHQVRATVRSGFMAVMKVSWVTSPLALAFAQKFLPEHTWVPFFNIVAFVIGTYINTHTKKKRLAALRRKVRRKQSLNFDLCRLTFFTALRRWQEWRLPEDRLEAVSPVRQNKGMPQSCLHCHLRTYRYRPTCWESVHDKGLVSARSRRQEPVLRSLFPYLVLEFLLSLYGGRSDVHRQSIISSNVINLCASMKWRPKRIVSRISGANPRKRPLWPRVIRVCPFAVRQLSNAEKCKKRSRST